MDSSSKVTKTGWIILAGVIPVQILLFFLTSAAHDGALVDDAFISFRYAARFAQGGGLTWNDGLHVEGFSNPLWTLILGGLARLGLAPHTVAPWLGLGSLLGTTVLVAAAGRRRGLEMTALIVVVAGIGLDRGAALWAGSGLETAPTAMVLAVWLWLGAGSLTRARDGLLLGITAAVLVLSRPEGFVWAAGGLVWLIWGVWASKRVLGAWILGMTPALGYLAFRVTVFDRLVPNTFYAKLEPGTRGLDNGLEQLGLWGLVHAMIWIPILWRVGGRGETGSRPRAQAWSGLLGGCIALQAVFVVLAGGDWMGHQRYLVPVLPALYLLAGEAVQKGFGAKGLRWRTGVVTAILLGHVTLGLRFGDRIPIYTKVGEQIGTWLKEAADPDDLLAVTAAGAIPYFSELPTHDVLGINDPRVAGQRPRHTGEWAPGHHRYDIDRLFELEPEWIVWDFSVKVNQHRIRKYRGWKGDPRTLDFRRSLLAHPRFSELYTIDRNAPPATQNAYTVFRRR